MYIYTYININSKLFLLVFDRWSNTDPFFLSWHLELPSHWPSAHQTFVTEFGISDMRSFDMQHCVVPAFLDFPKQPQKPWRPKLPVIPFSPKNSKSKPWKLKVTPKKKAKGVLWCIRWQMVWPWQVRPLYFDPFESPQILIKSNVKSSSPPHKSNESDNHHEISIKSRKKSHTCPLNQC